MVTEHTGTFKHVIPDPVPDVDEVRPVKKVTITDRDDAYLATLLGLDIADISIDAGSLGEVRFEGDNILNFTPPVPASTREWLLLALAEKLNEIEAAGANEIGAVEAPEKLASTDSLETAIETINSIINCLIDAGVFVDVKNASPEQPGMIDPEQ